MFVAIALETFPVKNIAVPLKYLPKLDFQSQVNDGVNQAKSILVFYNKNFNTTPDFSQEVLTNFSPDISACYYGHIVKYIGMYCRLK